MQAQLVCIYFKSNYFFSVSFADITLKNLVRNVNKNSLSVNNLFNTTNNFKLKNRLLFIFIIKRCSSIQQPFYYWSN